MPFTALKSGYRSTIIHEGFFLVLSVRELVLPRVQVPGGTVGEMSKAAYRYGRIRRTTGCDAIRPSPEPPQRKNPPLPLNLRLDSGLDIRELDRVDS